MTPWQQAAWFVEIAVALVYLLTALWFAYVLQKAFGESEYAPYRAIPIMAGGAVALRGIDHLTPLYLNGTSPASQILVSVSSVIITLVAVTLISRALKELKPVIDAVEPHRKTIKACELSREAQERIKEVNDSVRQIRELLTH